MVSSIPLQRPGRRTKRNANGGEQEEEKESKRSRNGSEAPLLLQEPVSSASESEEDDEDEASTSSSSGRGSDSDSDAPLSSPSPEDIVNVDFEFFDPKPDDFHGTRALLRTYLDDGVWDINGFVDLFLAQTTVGSVVKTSEEESPIGLISALNLGRYEEAACMKQIHQFLETRGGSKPEAKQLEKFWTKKANVACLLISERVINIPMDLVPPLYEGLFQEISWATEDEPTKELRNSFKFKHYLVLTKVFQEQPRKSKSSGSGQLENGKAPGDLIFIKPEDEILLKLSSWSFTFPVKLEASASHETKSMRQLQLVMGLNAEQMPVFMTELKDLVE